MAPGSRRGGGGGSKRGRRGGSNKPQAHKRRRGGGVSGRSSSGPQQDLHLNVGADWKRRRRHRPGPDQNDSWPDGVPRGSPVRVDGVNGDGGGPHWGAGGGSRGHRWGAGGGGAHGGAGANGESRRRNRPRGGRNSGAASRRRTGKKASAQRQQGAARTGKKASAQRQQGAATALQPIRVKTGGIMSAWKKPLGGLIRYYVHTRTTGRESPVSQEEAEEEIDQFYYGSGCCMEATKTTILKSLGVTGDIEKGWIDMSMAIEKEGQMDGIPIAKESNGGDDAMDVTDANGGTSSSGGFAETIDGKGIKLHQMLRQGEGPAHAHEQWTTIVVPPWAVGKSYFFEVKNNSPVDLSCELFLDGEQVAFNAPLPANATRTIKPDAVRYFQRHQWILNEAKRVKLVAPPSGATNGNLRRATPRYNGTRPDYRGQRVSPEHYPDPTTVGWQFTGSVEESRVEFFEKRTNNGGVVKLDFYYTTGTVKTVLHHPTSGRNQLFRALVTQQEYVAILQNPRAHTGKGYRRKEDRPIVDGTAANQEEGKEEEREDEEEEDEFDRVEDEKMDDADAPDENAAGQGNAYYARNDGYDFEKQGHQNRRNEMDKLQQSSGYSEWKQANMKEYAVVHARFFVSIPKRMFRAPPKTGGGGSRRRGGRQMQPLPVPQQSTVVDIKAAENCTLGTKYEVTSPPQRAGRSYVRMERVHGLRDEKEWKGDPVFEKKLYYRAESVVKGKNFGDDSDGMSDDDDEQPPVSENVPLEEYKKEKQAQLNQYYSELSKLMIDEAEAEQKLRNARNKICLSESLSDVDDIVTLFVLQRVDPTPDGGVRQ